MTLVGHLEVQRVAFLGEGRGEKFDIEFGRSGLLEVGHKLNLYI